MEADGRRGKAWPAALDLVNRYQNLPHFVEEEGQATGAAAVRFACGQAMAAGLVRRSFWIQRYPLARLSISTMRGRARIEGVSNGSLDLAIVTHDEPSILEAARRTLMSSRWRLTGWRSYVPLGRNGNRRCGSFRKWASSRRLSSCFR